MSTTPNRFDDLSPAEKRAALKRLLDERSKRPKTAPASFAQERLWVQERVHPGTPVFTEAGAVRITSSLDWTMLEQNLNRVVQRHEALRTTFEEIDGRPMQKIWPRMHVPVPFDDLRDLPEPQREPEAMRRAREQSAIPFDLEKGPLIRVHLMRTSNREHILVVTLHHIIADGWSIGVLVQELLTLTLAHSAGHATVMPDLPIQYSDFASWQREWLDGEISERQLAYWRSELAGLEPLELPTDRPRPVERSVRGGTLPLTIDEELTAHLRTLSRREGATLFMTLLAAFQTLLHRYTGGRVEDLAVGSPVAGRRRRELEGLIGFFVNMLTLRTDLSGDPTFRQLIGRVRATCLGAYENEDVPFERIVDEIPRGRSVAHSPLFQVVFALHRNVLEIQPVNGMSVRSLELPKQTAKYDLTFFLWEGTKDLTGQLEYNSDLFDASTVERMGRHLLTLLREIVADPDLRLSAIPILEAPEREALIVGRNRTSPATLPDATCLHHRFEAAAAARPENVALRCGDRSVTYGELDARANRLAHHLRAAGVGRETPVALYLERSPELVVAILATLKAGGYYVPISPQYPIERVRFMLDDTRAPVILASAGLVDNLPDHDARILRIEKTEEILADLPQDAPRVETTPGQLAYVIYTSGSTGKPKGVQISHANVSRLLDATDDRFGFGPDDAWTFFHSYAFDFSVWELWGALAYGGRLIVVPYLVSRSPQEFHALVRREGVTVLNQTPSAFRQFIRADRDAPGGNSLRYVIFGGEALDFQTLAPWLEAHPDDAPTLVNMYGITETTVHVTHRCLRAADAGRTASLVGDPIADLRLHVLDRNLAPAPLGVPGEIYVAGAGLARGYAGRPDLTAERFVPDPFAADGGRLYRTGDLARVRADGEIEFLGRIDHQVKIRGFRIELGEIETVLEDHPGVRHAVVIVREDEPGVKRLAAYLVTGDDPPNGELRDLLKARLPDYMIPSSFTTLEELPLTSNGKLDRKALPAPHADAARTQEYVPPRTAIERGLASVWSAVLGVERIGLHDNFFELGGDSILAIRVVSKAGAEGIAVSAKQLFQHQTLGELAAVAEQGRRVDAEQGAVTGPVPETPILRWFRERRLASPDHYNQAAVLQPRETVDLERLREAVAALVEHHDMLRATYTADGLALSEPEPEHFRAAVRRIDLRDRGADHAACVEEAAAALQADLDLERGDLLRVGLLDFGDPARDRIVVVIHHIATDGVSWRILLEDLALLYAGGGGLPPKTTSFRAWAERLWTRVDTGAFEPERAHWTEVARTSTSPLPLDRMEGDNDVASERRIEVGLDERDTADLLTLAQSAYRTQINDLLLTAAGRALTEWTGGDAIRIDLEGHGREELFDDVDLSRTVGWFTSMFPVLLEARPGDGSLGIKTVKEGLRRTPGNGIGYGLLRASGGADALPSAPAEVLFNYLGRFDGMLPDSAPFRPARESAGPMHGFRNARSHLLEVNGVVADDRLRVFWTYSGNRHDHATIAAVAESFARILRELIAHCLSPEAGGATPSDFPLARLDQAAVDRWVGGDRRVEDLYPLSPAQSGILFHSLLAPESAVYCGQLSCVIDGDLDVERFRSAWQSAAARHAILRTRFVWEDLDEPLQLVERDVEIPFEEIDLRDLDEPERERRVAAWLDADRRRGFALDRAPLTRIALLRLDDRRRRFVWSHHHLLLDGWSLSSLLRDVMTAYEAAGHGVELPLEPVRPYRDYIAWLRRADPDDARRFWAEEMAGLDETTPLVVDRDDRSGIEAADAFADREIELPEDVSRELESLARTHQLTLNTVVSGAWALLLSRYAGKREVVFGTTFSGRSNALAGIDATVGVFINTLPVRVRIDGRLPLVEWLAEQQRHQGRLVQFETTPLVDVAGHADVPRGTALFESLFIFENYPIDRALTRGGGSFDVEDVDLRGRPHYPLTVIAAPGPPVMLRIAYDRRRFSDATVERMIGHLAQILRSMARHPEAPVSEVELLDEATREHLLETFNETLPPAPSAETLTTRFERRVARSPDAPAVVSDGGTLTFAELDRRANRLGRRLLEAGAGPEKVVAVALPRSADALVALLAVLKTGAAYLPIEASHPLPRVRLVLEDSRAVALIAAAGSPRDWTGEDLPCGIVRPDAGTGGGESLGVEVPDSAACYVIYTSGSTGKPKGVVVEHRQVRNYVDAFRARLEIEDGASFAWLQPLSVDSSQSSIFPAWLGGGAVHVVDEETALEPERLAELFAERDVDCLKIAPSHLKAMQHGTSPERVLPRSLLIVGGEASSWEWLGRQPGLRPGCRVFNHYGPTEATVGMLVFPVGDGSHDGSVPGVPLGAPLPGCRAYVLDREMRPVPEGVPGELFIGGDCVVRGYLDRPELTARVFVPDPFSDRPGARLYRTGDLCRHDGAGAIEFLGRIDHQVKIRGFRIELAEVEAALRALPEVRDGVVVAREDRLCAFVVVEPGAAPEAGGLRDRLAAELPEPMVPASFTFIPELPRSAHGKVDLKALPEPDAPAVPRADHVAPRSERERALAAIWSELLGVEDPGIHDDFFELGGHSLLATQMMARLRQRLGVRLPLRELFEASTIAKLAELIERAEQAPALPPIEQVARDGELRLSYAQEGLWFLEQLLPGDVSYNMPGAIRLRGELDREALVGAFAEITRRHESLRTRFIRDADGQPRQIILPEADVPLSIVDLRSVAPEDRAAEIQTRLRREAITAFRLDRDPLLRLTLLAFDDDEHVLLATMHHIVSDGWSIGILIREFAVLYDAFRRGEGSPLPDLAFQVADVSEWQRGWLAGERLKEQADYWRRSLSGAPRIALPYDRERPAARTNRGAVLRSRLPRETADRVRALSHERRATPFMTLVAAFDLMLAHHSGQRDLTIGTDVAGRDRPGTEELIGFFVNQIVLRTRIDGNPTFTELLARVRETTLDAFAHQDLPFEKVVSALKPEREANRSPLFDVKLVLQNVPATAAALEGLELAVVEPDFEVAKFDILLNLRETEQGLESQWTYSTELFDAVTIESMHRDFADILSRVLEDPELRVDSLLAALEGGRRERRTALRANRKQANSERLRKRRPRRPPTP